MSNPSKRLQVYPEGHYRPSIDVTVSMGVKSHGLTFTAGQPDMEGIAIVRKPGDVLAQIGGACRNIKDVYAAMDTPLSDITKLVIFVGPDGGGKLERVMRETREQLFGDAPLSVSIIPSPVMVYPEMEIEIDAFGEPGGVKSSVQEGSFARVVSGETQFHLSTHGLVERSRDLATAVRKVISNCKVSMAKGKIKFEDLLRLCIWFETKDSGKDWHTIVKTLDAELPACRPVLFPVPASFMGESYDGPRVLIDGWGINNSSENAVRTTQDQISDLGRWPFEYPFPSLIRCGPILCTGGHGPYDTEGRIAADDLADQTDLSMRNLARVLDVYGASFDAVVKVTTCYAGDTGVGDYSKSHRRAHYFNKPGPASTGLVFPDSLLGSAKTVIELTAMIEDE